MLNVNKKVGRKFEKSLIFMAKLLILITGILGLFFLISCAKNIAPRKLIAQVGHKAPNFSLLDDTGKQVQLSDYLGQKVVLYFYPKDFTPGCTKQACSLRDSYADYRDHNIAILGVSYGSVESHQAFKAKHHLNFTLLSDTSMAVAKLYGANTGAKNYFFPKRMTFLINEQGVIIKIMQQVDVATHAQAILKAFGVN